MPPPILQATRNNCGCLIDKYTAPAPPMEKPIAARDSDRAMVRYSLSIRGINSSTIIFSTAPRYPLLPPFGNTQMTGGSCPSLIAFSTDDEKPAASDDSLPPIP